MNTVTTVIITDMMQTPKVPLKAIVKAVVPCFKVQGQAAWSNPAQWKVHNRGLELGDV